MREIEILENIDLGRVLEELRQRDKKLEVLERVDRDYGHKVRVVERQWEKRVEGVRRQVGAEREMKERAWEKMERVRGEMRVMEGKGDGGEVWKDKCKELFEICKELQKENEELKKG